MSLPWGNFLNQRDVRETNTGINLTKFIQVSAVDTISNSSGSYSDIADMEITIVNTGDYLINFQISARISSNATFQDGRFRITKNGSLEGIETKMTIQGTQGGGLLSTGQIINISLIATSLVAGDVIKAQWKDMTGTLDADNSANGGGRLLSVIQLK